MAWPSTPIDTTDMDAGTDSPASARIDLKSAVDAVNAMIAGRGSASGVASLDASSKILDAQLPASVAGSTVSNFIKGQIIQVEDDTGAGSASFSLTAIGTSYESIGPTGSGATNTWAALDSLPTTAKYIIVRVYDFLTTTAVSGAHYRRIYQRVTGSVTGLVGQALSHYNYVHNETAVARSSVTISTIIIPVDSSGRFDLALQTAGSISGTHALYLIGWGE